MTALAHIGRGIEKKLLTAIIRPGKGRRLLEQARTALRPGGRLYLVANRHLSHHRYLREAFAEVEVLGADARFSALRAVR